MVAVEVALQIVALSFDSVAVIACSSATAIAGLFFRYQLGTRPDSSPDGQNWLAHGERPLDPAWDRHESKSHDATAGSYLLFDGYG